MPKALKKIDRILYQIETLLATIVALTMVLVVFLAVTWDLFFSLQDTATKIYAALGILSVCCMASATRFQKFSLKSQGLGLLVASVVFLSGLGLRAFFPNGIDFSQKLALGLMMWMVFLGASIAAHDRRHILVEAAQKLVSPKRQKLHAGLGLIAAGLFTAFLCYLGFEYTLDHFQTYSADPRSGLFQAHLGIPNYWVSAAIPIGLFSTTLRFWGHAFSIFSGESKPYLNAEAMHGVNIDEAKE